MSLVRRGRKGWQGLPVGLVPALALAILPLRVDALTITAPDTGRVLRPGEEIDARVDLGTEVGMREVRYYWYRDGEEPLPRQLAHPALVANATTEPVYGGRIRVPDDAIGPLRLLAVGEVAKGRLGVREEFDEITVRVQPVVGLQAIDFEVAKPWVFDVFGRVAEIPALGQFADGVTRRIGKASQGSRVRSSNEEVIRVYPEGWVRVTGNGHALLTVVHGDTSGSVPVEVHCDDTGNRPPTARVDPEVRVHSSRRVVLNGQRSFDPDGDGLHFEWIQVAGNKVSLLDPYSAHPSFVAPKVSEIRLLRFRLKVTDMMGPDTVRGADSLPVFVNVWVEP